MNSLPDRTRIPCEHRKCPADYMAKDAATGTKVMCLERDCDRKFVLRVRDRKQRWEEILP